MKQSFAALGQTCAGSFLGQGGLTSKIWCSWHCSPPRGKMRCWVQKLSISWSPIEANVISWDQTSCPRDAAPGSVARGGRGGGGSWSLPASSWGWGDAGINRPDCVLPGLLRLKVWKSTKAPEVNQLTQLLHLNSLWHGNLIQRRGQYKATINNGAIGLGPGLTYEAILISFSLF